MKAILEYHFIQLMKQLEDNQIQYDTKSLGQIFGYHVIDVLRITHKYKKNKSIELLYSMETATTIYKINTTILKQNLFAEILVEYTEVFFTENGLVISHSEGIDTSLFKTIALIAKLTNSKITRFSEITEVIFIEDNTINELPQYITYDELVHNIRNAYRHNETLYKELCYLSIKDSRFEENITYDCFDEFKSINLENLNILGLMIDSTITIECDLFTLPYFNEYSNISFERYLRQFYKPDFNSFQLNTLTSDIYRILTNTNNLISLEQSTHSNWTEIVIPDYSVLEVLIVKCVFNMININYSISYSEKFFDENTDNPAYSICYSNTLYTYEYYEDELDKHVVFGNDSLSCNITCFKEGDYE